jgi:hypothetical protein
MTFRMPSVLFGVKATTVSPWIFSTEKQGRGEVESGGVLHHGTHEEDGPVTWEALSLLGRSRSDGEPVIHLRNWRVCRRTCRPPRHSAEQAPAPRGRPLARGTGAAAEGGKGVGGPNMSFDVGELVGDSDPAEQRRPVLM